MINEYTVPDFTDKPVKALFFGAIADKLGKHVSLLPASDVHVAADVVKAVGCEDFAPLLIAINQTQVNDMQTPIKAGDEIAIMPPFSGG